MADNIRLPNSVEEELMTRAAKESGEVRRRLEEARARKRRQEEEARRRAAEQAERSREQHKNKGTKLKCGRRNLPLTLKE